MKARLLPAGWAVAVLIIAFSPRPLAAQSNMSLTLTVNPQSISFAAADPDISPSVTADQPVRITIRASGMGSHEWQLTLRANGNLGDFWSLASIPISNVSWTATSKPPFRDGALADNVAQEAARAKNYQGSSDLTFRLVNLWTYWAGSYTQTVAITLSAV